MGKGRRFHLAVLLKEGLQSGPGWLSHPAKGSLPQAGLKQAVCQEVHQFSLKGMASEWEMMAPGDGFQGNDGAVL